MNELSTNSSILSSQKGDLVNKQEFIQELEVISQRSRRHKPSKSVVERDITLLLKILNKDRKQK